MKADLVPQRPVLHVARLTRHGSDKIKDDQHRNLTDGQSATPTVGTWKVEVPEAKAGHGN